MDLMDLPMPSLRNMQSNYELLSSNREKKISIEIKMDSTIKVEQDESKPRKPKKHKGESKLEPKKEPKREPKKGELKERIEFSQFKRSSIQSAKIKFHTCCRTILARRPTMLSLLEPDDKIFSGLDDVEPWDETILPPLPDDCTPKIIASIKKGMLLGKLYNMPRTTLKVIYPRLSLVVNERLVKGKGWIKKNLFRCPLCPKDFIIKSTCQRAYTHIEQYHTSSLVTCIKCNLSFTCYDSVIKHKARKHQNCK